MSHQDHCAPVRYNALYLQVALQWLLGNSVSQVCFRQDCTWLPLHLAGAALLWAWSGELTLVQRFFTSRKIIGFVYRPQRELAGSYQSFLKMLRRWTDKLKACLELALRERMQQAFPDHWEIHGFVLFGVDGSRLDLPRTKSHEWRYGYKPSKKKRSKRKHRKGPRSLLLTAPQIWLTLLWHAGTGLPWTWRIGPVHSSEREHCRQMLPELPANALIAADAGYIGYDYAQDVLTHGHQLLLRVGSNVRFLRKLYWVKESLGTVYLWPKGMQRTKPPLTLRLIQNRGGKQPIYLVTSVLSSSRLSNRQVLDLYRKRWGVEVYFRHLKQTYQRRKLRSGEADNARIELEWSLLGLWGMALYAQHEIKKQGRDPTRMSVATALLHYRRMMRDYRHPVEEKCSLRLLLGRALRDTYKRRDKSSQNYACKKRPDPPPKKPKIYRASQKEILAARKIKMIRKKG